MGPQLTLSCQVQESGARMDINDRLMALDQRLVKSAKQIRVLSRLSWPASVQKRFLNHWRKGKTQLPKPTYRPFDLTEAAAELDRVNRAAARIDHPIAAYLAKTAHSYRLASRLLNNVGKRAMTKASRQLYGQPGDTLSGGKLTNLDAARHFLKLSDEYYRQMALSDADCYLSAEQLKEQLLSGIESVFGPGVIRVKIDPSLTAKAAAGATRIRLRAGTCYSEYDLDQLLQHEAFVHSLTALNGRRQSRFKSFSLSAPRTTGPQEGLATFAELVTGAIDISRLERIALRVIAIDMALNGADFVEVFEYFLREGQTEQESYYSAMRVFRGAPLTGGSAFTKDTVYLHGLMEVHTFFRWSLKQQNLALTRHFFAGRMTIGDAVRLQPMFDQGLLDPPSYLPPWMTRTNGLAGYLAFSVFANRIRIGELNEGHRFDRPEQLSM